MSEYRIIEGDCVKAMKRMDEASIDAIVTDPPYELGFMGKAWDRTGIAYQQTTWAEALGILKPGGHLLAFGGTRTYHRLACAIEDAGFEIRDSLIWLYGSGFPKSLNLDGEWEGWGTALKPGHEPIVVARKPLTDTVAANVQEHGTGALNIDGCRIKAQVGDEPFRWSQPRGGIWTTDPEAEAEAEAEAAGRWPGNVVLSPEAAAELDAQSGESTSAGGRIGKKIQSGVPNVPAGEYQAGDPGFGDTGGASRFFYTAKASRGERNAGLGGFDLDTTDDGREVGIVNPYLRGKTERRNTHPTVKPIDLMRWLVRLVTPPGGTILDPFLGSGTTGCAAVLEGVDFIGIEREAEYVKIAEARIAFWSQHEGRDTAEVLGEANASERASREHAERGQLALKPGG